MVTNQYGNFDPRPLYSVGSSYTGAVTIPSTVDISGTTYTVTAIGPYAFVNCTGLTSVTLPNTITQIGSYAFADNVSSSFYFSTITIPNSVTTINDHAFYNTRLTTLYLGFGVETIGDYAFYESHYYLNDVYCYALLPPTIQSNTFFGTYYYSPTLHTLVYSNDFYKNDVDWKKFSTITTISGSTAYDAQIGGLYYQMVPWPESPGYYAKVVNNGNYNCYTSSSYTVPATVSWRSESFIVRYIENSAFRNCTNVSTLDLRNATNLKYIRDYACYGCTNLGTVRLSPALTSIGAYAFYDCTYLRNLYTNNSTPPTIQSTTFTSSQYNYASLYVPKPADVATYQAAPYWSNFTKYYAVQAYDFYTGGIYYLITGSNTVKVVNKYGSDYAFNEGEFSYSGNVSIPATVTYNGTTYRVTAIGENAFRESRAVNKNGAGETPRNQGDLKTVTVGNNVTTIEPNAFRDCTGLTSVTLGTGVTSIGSYAFNNCTALTSVISRRATPPTITSTTFDNSHYTSATLYVPSTAAVNNYKAATYWKNFTNITVFEAYVCYNTMSPNILTFYCDGLRSSRTYTNAYGNSITYDLNTGSNAPAWNGLSSITLVVFDESFANARPTSTYQWFTGKPVAAITGLSYLNTENVTNMAYMFYACTGLTSLDLSNFNTSNVTDMSYMFCSTNLLSLDVSSFNTSKVTNMSYMFNNCQNLTDLDVSSFNTSKVTNMSYMFVNCYKLTSLDLSGFNTAKVTNMEAMFGNCSKLTTIYAGSGWTTNAVTSSGNMFANCTKLVGGKGTTYNSSYVDKTRAHIDGGPSNPGYFTDINTSQAGDVNGDGQVTIADVTALIDSLLSGVEVPLDAADVNGDGSVTIADVTALIDMLLGS